MSSESTKNLIRSFFEEVLNEQDLQKLGEYVSDDYVEHSPSGQGTGVLGVKEHIRAFFSAFSGIHYDLQDLIAEGNKVVARWKLTGTHTGDFMGIHATGRAVETTGIDIYFLENGRIKEHWHEIDIQRLTTQLNPRNS